MDFSLEKQRGVEGTKVFAQKKKSGLTLINKNK